MTPKAGGSFSPSNSRHSPQDQPHDQKDRKDPFGEHPNLVSIFSPFHAGTLLGMRKGKHTSFLKRGTKSQAFTPSISSSRRTTWMFPFRTFRIISLNNFAVSTL